VLTGYPWRLNAIYRDAQNKTNARFICEEAGEVKATLRYSEAEAITSALLDRRGRAWRAPHHIRVRSGNPSTAVGLGAPAGALVNVIWPRPPAKPACRLAAPAAPPA
jgi:hypothetical protein